MWIVKLALRRPYTFIVMSILIAVLGFVSMSRMATDIFPFINIPVVSVIWSYTGLPAEEMESRLTTISERAITTVTSDIDHMESTTLNGLSIIKIYLHQSADVGRCVATITAISQTLLRAMPAGITPPLITSFNASDVPILQLGLGSKVFSESEIFDFGLNNIRTNLSGVEGCSIPLPYGGKFRQVMVDLNPSALQANNLSAYDVSQALNAQNIIIPSGTAKIGDTEYAVQLNSSPTILEAFDDLPIKQINGATIYLRDVAHVHDGYSVQTNIVHQNGRRSILLNVLRQGGASTIAVVDRIKAALPKVMANLPPELHVQTLTDQSKFVKAAVDGVVKEAITAAGLTALLILLLLGSWRSTVIVAISIPLSILAAIVGLNACGQTLNTMTLGGLALAVGMLVDDATVEVENIHRNFAMGKPIVQAILDGAEQIAVPAFVSTVSICIVFVPVFLLNEPARSLFVPMGLSVVFAMMMSYILSRTLVPVMARYLMGAEMHMHKEHSGNMTVASTTAVPRSPFGFVYYHVNSAFEKLREHYGEMLGYVLRHRMPCIFAFLLFYAGAFALSPYIGQDFFPQVDAGQLRLHVEARTGTRIEETERVFGKVENAIRKVIPETELETIIDNIGIPSSGINLAYGDNITKSNFDGEILISLKENHKTSTFEYAKLLRSMLNKDFPDVKYFFQPADIVSQILNAGLPAPIDIQVTGRDKMNNFKVAEHLRERVAKVKGAVDVTLHQVMDGPQLQVNVDHTKANQLGFTQRDIANSLLIMLASSQQVAPNFWVNPKNGVSYALSCQMPTYRINSVDDIMSTMLTAADKTAKPQMLVNMATVKRSSTAPIVSHYKIQPVFDVFVNVQNRDLGGVAADIQKILDEMKPALARGSVFIMRGQADSMNSAFMGLATGTLFALLLVYLLLVVNFQSWIDPLIILMAIPGAFAGIVLALFATQTTFSVPALMGAIMSIGVASANSILLITFANEKLEEGEEPLEAALRAGFTRFRPVIMTAAAMIIGMFPMALGLGEGGSQNAPLGRALIGGLLVATTATLLFVPCIFVVIRQRLKWRPVNQLEDPVGDHS
ncbi:MAG: efflux RND transporter permease subunit [Candidatus Obscuribacterales bacterium]|nr:efflux RND transporter permease subunit [Candidatus Obscuribacterales bacterium]